MARAESFLDEMQRRRGANAPKTARKQKPYVQQKAKRLGASPKQAQAQIVANRLARKHAAKNTERTRAAPRSKKPTNGLDRARPAARPSSLTARGTPMAKKGKSGKKSGGGKTTKPRTAKQKAATARMIAANKSQARAAEPTRSKPSSKPKTSSRGKTSKPSTALAKRPSVGAAASKTRNGDMVVAYAMDNNMGLAEGLLGSGAMLAWMGLSTVTLRMLATHAVTAPTTAPAAGQPIVYSDAPKAGQQYNWISVDAPMNLIQWGVGVGIFVVAPILIARMAFEPGLGRSTMQFMFLGGVASVGGKGVKTGIAYLFRKTGWAQQIFAPEINAQQANVALAAAVKANAQYTQPALPNAIPLAAGMTLTPPQPGVAGAPSAAELEAQRRAAGVGNAPAQQNAEPRRVAPPPPPPPPPDDDAPQVQSRIAARPPLMTVKRRASAAA